MKKKCMLLGLVLLATFLFFSCASQRNSSSYRKTANGCPAYGKNGSTYERLPY